MKFTINGIPPKKDRPRFGKGKTYSTDKTREGENRVRYSFLSVINRPLMIVNKPIKVIIKAFYSLPPSWTKKKKLAMANGYKITIPDSDNIIKAVLDGLNKVAFKDDNLVSSVECTKMYADSDYTEVEIIEL